MKPAAHQPWNRLVAAARRAPADASGDLASPFGFSARVVSLADLSAASTAGVTVLLERFSMRALGCAFAVLMVSAVWSVAPTATAASRDDRSLDLIDPVGEVLQVVQTSR